MRPEKALHDSDARLELAARAANLGIWDWNLETDELVLDERARAIWRLPSEGPITQAMMAEAMHPEDLVKGQEHLRRAIDPDLQDRSPFEYRLRRGDGQIRWVRAYGQAVFREQEGRLVPVRYVGTMADITEERSREEALINSERRLRLALDVGRMAVWSLDGQGELQATPELSRLLGLPEEAQPTLEDLQARYYPGEVQRVQALGEDAAARGQRYFEFEYRHLWPDDSVRWLLVRAELLRDEHGEPDGVIGVVVDITERKAAEERLSLLAREVDHRANNLLAVVQGAISLADAPTVGEFKAALVGRVAALARAHQLLATSRWLRADLRTLVEEELRPYSGGDGRCRICGPKVSLSPAMAQSLSLAIHELATNAVKHGALSRAGGTVTVEWSGGGRDSEPTITWIEAGGPPVRRPAKRGMGTRLISRALAAFAGGRTELDWRPEGLICRLHLGAEPGAPAPPSAPAPVEYSHR